MMQEVLMLIAAALMTLSVYKTATLDDAAANHLTGALAAQGVGPEATVNARALMLDAMGPGDGHRMGGFKCLTFDVTVSPLPTGPCRAMRMTVEGSIDTSIEGNLCLTPGGLWTEAAQAPISSKPIDLKWRDTVLKSGATLYRDPAPDSPKIKFDWPDTNIQVGGYLYSNGRTLALIRLPNGESRYAGKADLVAPRGH